jgi:hypoxanthine phosphoribosyltransferase
MTRRHVPKPLIKKFIVRQGVYDLGSKIQHDFAGKELTLISVLTGSIFFTVDLMRRLGGVVVSQLETVYARSYVGIHSGQIEVDLSNLKKAAVTGRNVLLIDDILDSGKTLWTLAQKVRAMEPASFRTAVLLRKEGCQLPQFPITPDYVAFDIPNKFVVGYGLDYNGHYRELSYIGIYNETEA